jgi:hypothetical protein
MIGLDAFGIRYRPVEISETEYSEGGRWTRTHVRIKVRIMGDINGDGKVDMKDVAIAVSAFYSWPDKSRWNPDCDLDLNGIVNMRDIVLIVKNFGECA